MSTSSTPASRPRRSAAAPRSRNRLLAALPPNELAVVEPHLESLDAQLRHLIWDVDQPIEWIYFPEGMIGSIVGVMADGTAVETATIGHEGMVGLPVFLGTDRTSSQAFCQVPGPTLRMPASAFREVIGQLPQLRRLLNCFTQALFTLVGQNSACNRVHTMTERCARWLLKTHDRVAGDDYPLTHQVISQMLGVRRATVTEAMGYIQERGAIEYEMGRIHIRDRALLESLSCECYTIIAREFERLLGGQGAPPMFKRTPTAEDGMSTVGDGTPRRSSDDS